jgi:hypothetical protein
MKIYIAHSRNFDFQKELYNPIRNSPISKEHTFIFPHEESGEPFNSKELFQKGCDLIIAEVSHPSTSIGIELGWADMLNVPIVCIYKKGSEISSSLKTVAKIFLEYSDMEGLINKVREAVLKPFHS